MSSRYAAARPSRAGEAYARTHHHEDDDAGPSRKQPKFDVRNPSALAPDAPEEDVVLEADVIGSSGAGMKRGAVNLDGYDSDSENEGFDGRAEERAKEKRGDKDLAEALDGYESKRAAGKGQGDDDDDDDDMFGGKSDADEDKDEEEVKTGAKRSKKDKSVRFLEDDEIQGQVLGSKSGGHISSNFALDPKGKLSSHAMDDNESSDDEEDAVLAAEEDGIDEEVGAGGLKRNAPKVDAFNMKAEQEDGRFDQDGNFVRKAIDPDAKHDQWLEGVSKKDMKRAAEAHERRDAEQRQKRLEDDAMLLPDILQALIVQLEKGETVLEALARLGKRQTKSKKIPKWKLKKLSKNNNMSEDMDVDGAEKRPEDPEQVHIREAILAITEAADRLLTRGQTEIYEQEREMLIRQYTRETGESWVEPVTKASTNDTDDDDDDTMNNGGGASSQPSKMWEFRWIDGRDGGLKQGPYDGATMTSWQDAGYFVEGVEFRKEGDAGGAWSRIVDFL